MLIRDVCAAEKALVSLPNSSTACDGVLFSRGADLQVIKLTAGFHRQTWVSGMTLFVNVHNPNSNRKTIKRVKLQLGKATFYYDHAAASTTTEAANRLKYQKRTEKDILQTVATKKARQGREGIPAQSEEIRARDIAVPAGLVTMDAGA